MDSTIDVSQIILDRFKFQTGTAISQEILENATIREMLDPIARRLLVQLEVELLGNRAGRIIYTFPATVWQMFKARHFPKLGRFGCWLLARHPVREEAKAFSARAMFPEATMVYPKEFGPVSFHVAPSDDYYRAT